MRRASAWSADSRWVIVGAKTSPRACTQANHIEGYAPPTLAGHQAIAPVAHVAFGDAGETAYTVSKDGALFEWRLEDDDKDAEAPERGGRSKTP